MIEVRNLTKYYGNNLAVDDINFKVEKGEIIGLLGPNGAGKTTIMRILTCALSQTTGQATVAGHDVITDSLAIRRKIGYLPENPPLYPELKVQTYLKFMARLKEVPRNCLRERIEYVIELFKLQEVRKKTIDQLSRGFRQRVGLAQALISDPEIIILDEPTVGLDPRQITDVRAAIKDLARKHTVILSTHILPEVSMTCDAVIIINNGKIVALDSINNLDARMVGQKRLRLKVRGEMPRVEHDLLDIPGVARVLPEDTDGEELNFIIEGKRNELKSELITETLINKGWGVREIFFEKATLEEIYLRLVTDEKASAPKNTRAGKN